MTETSEPPNVLPYASDLMEFLSEEGFRPTLDEDGDVLFKFEGSTYIVITAHGEPTCLNLLFPYFWSLDGDQERQRAHEAAAHAQQSIRVGRVTLLNNNVTASIDAYLPDDAAYKGVFLRNLGALQALVRAFRDHMHAQAAN